MLFDYMAIVMDKQALADEDFTVNVTLPDVGERHMLPREERRAAGLQEHAVRQRGRIRHLPERTRSSRF